MPNDNDKQVLIHHVFGESGCFVTCRSAAMPETDVFVGTMAECRIIAAAYVQCGYNLLQPGNSKE